MRKIKGGIIAATFVVSLFSVLLVQLIINPVSAENNCGIVINEINTGGVDWVELYNYGPPRDLSNWQFYWQDERG